MGTLNLFFFGGRGFVVALFCFLNETGEKITLSHKQNSKQMLSNMIQVIFFPLCNFSELISTKTSAVCISLLLSKEKQNR